MSDLNKALLETIQQNLSGQVAGELTTVLKEWERFNEDLPKALDDIKKLREVNLKFTKMIDFLEQDNKKLKKESEEVAKQKRKNESDRRSLEMNLMTKELEMLQTSKDDILNLVDKVFSVPTVTTTNSKHDSAFLCPSDHYTTQRSEIETTTTETKK